MIIYGYRNFLDADAYRSDPVRGTGPALSAGRQLIDYSRGPSETGCSRAGRSQTAERKWCTKLAGPAAAPAPGQSRQEAGQGRAEGRRTSRAKPCRKSSWLRRSWPPSMSDPQLADAGRASRRHRRGRTGRNGQTARRRRGKPAAVAGVHARLPRRDRAHLPPAGRDVRPHAGREFLS